VNKSGAATANHAGFAAPRSNCVRFQGPSDSHVGWNVRRMATGSVLNGPRTFRFAAVDLGAHPRCRRSNRAARGTASTVSREECEVNHLASSWSATRAGSRTESKIAPRWGRSDQSIPIENFFGLMRLFSSRPGRCFVGLWPIWPKIRGESLPKKGRSMRRKRIAITMAGSALPRGGRKLPQQPRRRKSIPVVEKPRLCPHGASADDCLRCFPFCPEGIALTESEIANGIQRSGTCLACTARDPIAANEYGGKSQHKWNQLLKADGLDVHEGKRAPDGKWYLTGSTTSVSPTTDVENKIAWIEVGFGGRKVPSGAGPDPTSQDAWRDDLLDLGERKADVVRIEAETAVNAHDSEEEVTVATEVRARELEELTLPESETSTIDLDAGDSLAADSRRKELEVQILVEQRCSPVEHAVLIRARKKMRPCDFIICPKCKQHVYRP
jgi:hypothetical protein